MFIANKQRFLHQTRAQFRFPSSPLKFRLPTSSTPQTSKLPRFVPAPNQRKEIESSLKVQFKVTFKTSSQALNSANLSGDITKKNSFITKLVTENLPILASLGNVGILCCKGLAWWITGSSAMLAETFHSLADTVNQALLIIGVKWSSKPPDNHHPYGYENDRYIWALISAVGVFCVGSALSFVNGFSGLFNPVHPETLTVAIAVLGVSFATDLFIFLKAYQSLSKKAKEHRMGLFEFIREGPVDPLTLSVLAEDGSSMLGGLIATSFLSLSYFLDNPIYDPLGSIGIGAVMGLVAGFLIMINRQFLLGRSIQKSQHSRIMQVLSSDPLVKNIHDVRSLRLGMNVIRFKAELKLDGEFLAKQYLHRKDFQQLFLDLKSPADLEKYLINFGTDYMELIGDEIDRIEQGIRDQVPELAYIDLEIL